jgi:protein-disulfide isomerase
MRALASLALAFTLLAQVPDWKTSNELPSLDTTGLTAAQKQTLLKLLRENSCTCGCTMKIAQCRIEDPKCAVSRSLASIALHGLRDGKTPADIHKMLEAGPGPAALLEDPVALNIEGSPSKGPANARITLVEFSDFQCPYCSIAIHELDAILAAYPKDVRLVFKQFPLSDLHPNATLAAHAALAANAQGKFWPMHDKLFANSRALTRSNMLKWAGEMQLDMKRFTADLDSPKLKQDVVRDVAEGEKAGVDGTPTVFVNGKHYNGPLDPQQFGEVLKSELKPAKK